MNGSCQVGFRTKNCIFILRDVQMNFEHGLALPESFLVKITCEKVHPHPINKPSQLAENIQKF